MQTVVLERESTQVPWGFRLKGGSEYNVPLSILKVNEGSPAHLKLDTGDVLVSVGQYSTANLKHEEALNLIRMFDLKLTLGIQRESQAKVSSGVWKPSSTPVVKPTTLQQPQQLQQQFDYSFNNNNINNSNQISYQNLLAPTSYVTQQQQQQPQPQVSLLAPQQPSILIPPAPPLPIHLSPNSFFDSPAYSPKQQRSEPSPPEPAPAVVPSGHIPNALIKAMAAPNGSGRKPFTYTPGGLDLSHVRESARVKRYDSISTNNDNNPYQGQKQPNQIYNRQYSAPQQHQQQQIVYNNSPKPAYNPPKAQNASQFVVQAEQLQEQRSRRRSSRDENMNQSYTFKMLNKWIEDSETRELLKPKTDDESSEKTNEKDDKNKKPFLNSAVAKLLKEEEMRSKHQQAPSIQIQRQASIESPNFHSPNSVPSRTFKQLDRAYNNDIDESNKSKVPPRERNPEPDAPKYKGANIPSRTFKYIQYLTGDENHQQQQQQQDNEFTVKRSDSQQRVAEKEVNEQSILHTPNQNCVSEF